MKANGLRWFLLFLLVSAVFRLLAQQSEADRKLLADLRALAEKGDAQSQYELGLSFHNGSLGVAKDEAEAAKWYRKAAEQNDPQAQYNLGVCYAKGEGVAQDYVKAVKWFRKAAEQNDAQAQYNLGICYAKGQGVRKDYVEASKWMLLAAEQGDEDAKKNVAALEVRMTREQIAEGQKLARNFKPREVPSSGGDSSAAGIAQTRPECSGTGFFITEDGYLITNEHVAGNGAQVRLVTEAGLISAKVVKVDAANDLALLKVEEKFVPLPVVSSRVMKWAAPWPQSVSPISACKGLLPSWQRVRLPRSLERRMTLDISR